MNMTDETKGFLMKNLPKAFEVDAVRDALNMLFDLIEEKGFAPPHYQDYNDFGRQAQRAYDDIYLSSLEEADREKYRVKSTD